ncbi:transposase insI for insertion sequence element IS30B/C/D domain protein [Shigella dysenteriae 155-74]|nr:transposase insI for insertion sequence element IS30B/C/D domain protein [Shigella dysenteriae 155-74]
MRRTFTAEEKASVFELWKNGTGFSEIANILGSKPGTIFTMLRDTGGIKPHERKRAVAHLTLSEREEIRAGLFSQNEHSCDSYCAESQSFDDLT